MFCSNCGNKVLDEGKFCMECGTPIGVTRENVISTPVHTVQMAEDTSVQASTQAQCLIRFIPKKIPGQMMVSKATIVIAGTQRETKFKHPVEFMVDSGEVTISCFMNYMGKSGKARIDCQLLAGKKYEVLYKTPAVVLANGSIDVREFF